MSATNPATEPLPPTEQRSGLRFSVRDLLVLTAIVSICLAVGVHFAGFVFVVVALGLIQAVTLLSADWLIRPQNRQALAFVTAASWTTLGSGLLILAIRAALAANDVADAKKAGANWILCAALTIGSAFCYVAAAVRWRQLKPRASHTD